MGVAILVRDHLENEFVTLNDMLKHYDVAWDTYFNRIKAGWNLEDILTKPVEENRRRKIYTDYKGNTFHGFRAMCQYYNIPESIVLSRLKQHWTLQDALERPPAKKRQKIEFQGKVYWSLPKLLEAYGISRAAFNHRIARGWDFDRAVLTPMQEDETRDTLGNRVAIQLGYKSLTNMAEQTGIARSKLSKKIFVWSKGPNSGDISKLDLSKSNKYYLNIDDGFGNRYNSLRQLVESGKYKPSLVPLRKNFKLGFDKAVAVLVTTREVKDWFIGLDGKAYYQFDWAPTPQTARQAVEHYRPDLLDLYDQYNPTGKWNPYIEGVADNSGKSN